MKNSYVSLALATLSIAISGTVIQAYLSPEDVFNIQIPEEQETASGSTASPESVQSTSQESSAVEDMPIQEEVSSSVPTKTPPVAEQSSSLSSAMMIKESASPASTTKKDPISKAQESSQGNPLFYRSGKTLEKYTAQEQSSKPTADPVDVFDNTHTDTETPTQTGATTQAIEVASGTVVEQIIDTPPIEEEQRQPSAPNESLFLRLLGASSYYVVGFAILLAAGLYGFLRKKPQSVPVPENTLPDQIVSKPEESSPRLEQALKAMEAEGISEAANRLKEIQHPEQ